MATHDRLIELERDAWAALSSSGDEATAFYDEVLADDVLMLLPGGLVIDDRREAIESMGGDAWESVELSGEQVLDLTDASAVVSYRARARRGDLDYAALFNSTYVRHGDTWRLTLHQQTPL